MVQPGFFDLQHRYEGLDVKSDPLVPIAAAVPFELFRAKLKTRVGCGWLRTADGERWSAAGRMTARSSTMCSIPTTQLAGCGPTAPIAARSPRRSWPRAG